jgi:phosphohistidine phosphatase
MNLILWRHATAEELPSGGVGGDSARALTHHGQQQARAMAAWLNARLPADCDIVVSPAVRTRQTADALCRPYRVSPAIAPGASARAVLAATGWPDHAGTVLVVGHQPTLGRVAATLMAGVDAAWPIRRAAAWWFAARDEEEGSRVALRAVMSADLVAGPGLAASSESGG